MMVNSEQVMAVPIGSHRYWLAADRKTTALYSTAFATPSGNWRSRMKKRQASRPAAPTMRRCRRCDGSSADCLLDSLVSSCLALKGPIGAGS